MWHSAFLTVFTLFLCCSWLWTVGFPTIQNHDTITTNVQLNLIQQPVLTLGNVSVEGPGWKTDIRHDKRLQSKEQKVPKYMMDLYKKYNADNNSGRTSTPVDIVRSIPPIATASMSPRDQNYHDNSRRHLLVFDVSVSKRGEVLETAELKVSSNSILNELSVSSLDSNDVQINSEPKILAGDVDVWTTFNVTQFLLNRITHPRGAPIKFIVHSTDENPMDNDILQSMLILSYSTPREPVRDPVRRRRSVEAEDYEEESNNVWDDDMWTAPRATTSNPVARRARRLRNTCRRRPLYVDFSEIHYDSWIVAPNGYEAFQCLGKCFFPVSEHLSPTKHAIVQTLIHSVSPGKVSRACCVPTRLEPISVLYVDQRGVLTYRFSYQDMVVAECGCR